RDVRDRPGQCIHAERGVRHCRVAARAGCDRLRDRRRARSGGWREPPPRDGVGRGAARRRRSICRVRVAGPGPRRAVVTDAPARRQATLTTGAVLLCGLDILLGPILLLIAAFVAPKGPASATAALIAIGAGCLICGLGTLAAGLAGAPRRLVFWLAL